MSPDDNTSDPQPIETWDDRYNAQEQIWSGRVNAMLSEVAEELSAGSALDLGCGEGADAVWLATSGWQVTAVDVSATALARTRAAADDAGVADRITTQRHDLVEDFPGGTFDLVSSQYLHSSQKFPRTAVLQRATQAVTPGGRLLIVDHGAPPPWMPADHEHPEFETVSETFASLDLATDRWQVERLDTARRRAEGPSGETGELVDNVILIRRIA